MFDPSLSEDELAAALRASAEAAALTDYSVTTVEELQAMIQSDIVTAYGPPTLAEARRREIDRIVTEGAARASAARGGRFPDLGEWLRRKAEAPEPETDDEAEPAADAHAKTEEPKADAQGAWKPKAWCWQDPTTLPRLEALYGGHYYRGEVVATVAPGGVGKSMHSIVEALAMITGKPLLGDPSRGGLRVMLMNYEDSDLVLRHRVTAALMHHRIRPEEISGKLFVESMDLDLMCFAKGAKGKRDGVEIVEPSVDALVDAIRDNRIDVVILDPWVSVHQVDGNLSHLIQPIMSMFKAIAQATNAAIEIVAHSRKPNGRELTEDDALGSVAFVNKTRDVRVLNKMDDIEAAKNGIQPWQAGDYFRVDNPKHTHRRSAVPVWRQKISVSLGNKGPGLMDFASEVGVVAEWSPPSKEDVAEAKDAAAPRPTPEQVEKIIGVFRGMNLSMRKDKQSPQWAGYAVMPTIGLDVTKKADKDLMGHWFDLLIKSDDLKDVVGEKPSGHPAPFITISDKTRGRLEASEN